MTDRVKVSVSHVDETGGEFTFEGIGPPLAVMTAFEAAWRMTRVTRPGPAAAPMEGELDEAALREFYERNFKSAPERVDGRTAPEEGAGARAAQSDIPVDPALKARLEALVDEDPEASEGEAEDEAEAEDDAGESEPQPAVMLTRPAGSPKWGEIYDPECRTVHPDNAMGLDFITLGEDVPEVQGVVLNELRRGAIPDEEGRAYYPHSANVAAEECGLQLGSVLGAMRGLAKKGLVSRASKRGATVWVL